ncbi:MAG: DUF1552 domain-containing protein, partial [Myxococcales bacterium]|nr:DUF1552 domain-containing protein [Myxococcales bacterium]
MSHFNANRNSGRRAFLRGVGGFTLGLPLLEFTHERAWAAGGPLKRFVVVYHEGGETMAIDDVGNRRSGNDLGPKIDDWLPMAGWQFGQAQVDFRGTALESKMLVLRGIDSAAGYAECAYNSEHYSSNATCLTQATIGNRGVESVYANGPSIDYVVAQRLAARLGGRSSPLHYTVPGSLYTTPFYTGTLGSRCTRSEGEYNPLDAFNRDFKNLPTGGSTTDPAATRAQQARKNLLNTVMDGYAEFSKKLGTSDKAIVDAHLDHLSDIEKQIMTIEPSVMCAQPPTSDRLNTPDYYQVPHDKTGPILANLIVAAMRCGITNVAGLQIGDTMAPIKSTVGAEGHSLGHEIQRYGKQAPDPSEGFGLGDSTGYAKWLGNMRATRKWRLGLAKSIAEQLNDTSFLEGGRPMLDNSLVLYTTEASCGGAHQEQRDIPFMLLGGGAYFRTGRYVDFNPYRQADPNSLKWSGKVASSGQVFTTVLQSMGATDQTFGEPKY